MSKSIVSELCMNFSIRIVKLYKYLTDEKKVFVLSKQLLRSGTSIGANVAEAQQAQSKADFISKISIALKETTETKYWLRLLNATDYLSDTEIKTILSDCVEIEKILTTILKSSKV
jgi:four helix bundle protein